jgi:hypothetical protein
MTELGTVAIVLKNGVYLRMVGMSIRIVRLFALVVVGFYIFNSYSSAVLNGEKKLKTQIALKKGVRTNKQKPTAKQRHLYKPRKLRKKTDTQVDANENPPSFIYTPHEQNLLKKNVTQILADIDSGKIYRTTKWYGDIKIPKTTQSMDQIDYWLAVKEAYEFKDLTTLEWLNQKAISPARTMLLLVDLLDLD